MKNSLNSALLMLVALSIFVGCKGEDHRNYKGEELQNVPAEDLVVDARRDNGWRYKNKLVRVQSGKFASAGDSGAEITIKVDMHFYNFGKRPSDQLPAELTFKCQLADSERSKVGGYKVGDVVIVNGKATVPGFEAVIEDCHIEDQPKQ